MARLSGQQISPVQTQPSGQPTPGGFITSAIGRYAGGLMPGGTSVPVGQAQATVWDQLQQHFTYTYPQRSWWERNIRGPRPPASFRSPTFGQAEQQQEQALVRERARLQQDRTRLKELAKQAGLDPENPVMLANLWAAAVKEAEAAYSVDPRDPMELVWEVLQRWAAEGAPGTFKAQDTLERQREEWYGAQEPYSETRVDKATRLTDPDTARQLVIETLRQRIGREPTEAQIRSFVAALNARERANPSVTTTVTQYAADGKVLGTTSSTEGGDVNPAGFASEFQEEQLAPEERAFTAGVTYDSVIDALVGGY